MALIRKLRGQKRRDDSRPERFQFFADFKSPNGSQLDDSQIQRLVSITTKWELDKEDVKVLQLCSLLWAENPSLFWDGEKHHDNIIRRSFSDLERMREIDPTRRKILLVILSREIEHEQRQAHENTEQRRRQNLGKSDDRG